MKSLKALLKTEMLLASREFSAIFFGVLFPMAMALLLGFINGDQLAYGGAVFTKNQQAFGALISIGICACGLMGLPLNLADYRHKHILKRFKVTPISPLQLLLAQIMISLFIAIVSAIGVWLVLKVFFGYHMIGSIFHFILAYFLLTFAIFSLGGMIASLAPNMKTANFTCTIIYFPMLFLSGATIPYEILPKSLQTVSNVLPLTQGIKLLKGVSLGQPIDHLVISILLLIVVGVVSLSLSVKFFRWD
ncbi:MAG: ABC transporter permease [Firmicutes bacterium HGW-Firmicutes-1]|jgi:ABC-2 type transport system permease protein|nr:MAG: ABC transporter permease [Firmicutes bacterium HGW-Firmicutes-1]